MRSNNLPTVIRWWSIATNPAQTHRQPVYQRAGSSISRAQLQLKPKPADLFQQPDIAPAKVGAVCAFVLTLILF